MPPSTFDSDPFRGSAAVASKPLAAESGECLHRLVELAARRWPDVVALEAKGRRLTFAQLWERAGGLAEELARRGVEPGSVVGLCPSRSIDLVVGALAIMVAGGAVLPIDPAFPSERQARTLAAAGARLVLNESGAAATLAPGVETVVMGDGNGRYRASGGAEFPEVGPEDLAYVVFTSGSSGDPKGVALPHRGLVNEVVAIGKLVSLRPGDRVLQFCSLAFDASIEEIYATLAAGATLVLRPDDLPVLGAPWRSWLIEAGITVADLPTAYWHAWVQDLAADGAEVPPALRTVIVGGERALGSMYRRWLDVGGRRAQLINTYGPTEVSVSATAWAPPAGTELPPGADPPIGRPLPGVRAVVLGKDNKPVIPGATGELLIGGVGLARGYVGNAELTAARFVPDSVDPYQRLYRTGDLARWGSGGDLEFMGRLDRQVKIRGFRVEPGAVEAALCAHPLVTAAVVVAREDRPGERRLVAYVVAQAAGDTPTLHLQLRRLLAAGLAAYAVPDLFVAIDAIPVGPTGKVDVGALPQPRRACPPHECKPASPTEVALAAVWCQVLGVEHVGADEDFFELGGNSLAGATAVARVRAALGVEVGLDSFFNHPTVRGLARVIDELRRDTRRPIERPPCTRVARAGNLPLSFAQQRLWFLDQLSPGEPVYNVPATYRLRGSLDVRVLRRVLDELVDRHEALRTTFPAVHGIPHQRVSEPGPVALQLFDLSSADADQAEARARRVAGEFVQRPFDLAQGPLTRFALLRLAADDHVLLLTMHHIVSDAWSVVVLTKDFAALYRAFAAGDPYPLAPLPVQFADFSAWQRRLLEGPLLETQLAYWRTQLQGTPTTLELPTDQPRPRVPSHTGDAVGFTLSPPLATVIADLARNHKVSLFMTLLAGLKVVLASWAGVKDLVVGAPVADRPLPQLEGLVGFFVNTVVLRTDLSDDPPFVTVLQRVRATVVGALQHQDLPFDRVVQEVAPARDPSRMPLVQVMFEVPPLPPRLERLGADLDMIDIGCASGCDFGDGDATATSSPFDLDLLMAELGDGGIAGRLVFATDLFTRPTIERLVGRLIGVLQAVASDPARRVSELGVLPSPSHTGAGALRL